MADIFREIDEELRQENYLRLWRKYGSYVIGAAVALVALAAAVVGWREYRQSQLNSASDRYEAALTLADEGKLDDARALFASLVEDGAGGYPALARLNQAALAAKSGDRDGAVAVYDALAADGDVDDALRGVATVLGAMQRLSDAKSDPAAITARLEPLAKPDGPWRHSAREILALLAQRQGDTAKAKSLYRLLADDLAAPAGIRGRATEMLELLGG